MKIHTHIVMLASMTLSGCVTVHEDNNNAQHSPIDMADTRIALGLNYVKLEQYSKARQSLEKSHEICTPLLQKQFVFSVLSRCSRRS